MTEEEINILTSDRVQAFLQENIDADPAALALSNTLNGFPRALVSTQLKYLQKSRKKLPTYYNHSCIIPPLAYEQASSEATAAMKRYKGKRCLDLTCGLGVDSLQFTQHFDEVVAVELDEGRFRVAQANFALMGIDNIRVVHADAQDFLAQYDGPAFDLIYLDPARRSATGSRVHDLEAYSPDVMALLPRLMQLTKQLVVKVSPLYDIDAARQAFPALCHLHIHSLGFECKELLLEWKVGEATHGAPLTIGVQWEEAPQFYEFPVEQEWYVPAITPEPAYILEPDPAFYKARVLPALFKQYFPELAGALNDPMGYFLASSPPPSSFPGKVYEVIAAYPFKRKVIRQDLKRRDIRNAHITKRVFPMTVADIHRQIGTRASGQTYMLLATTVAEALQMYLTRRVKSH